MPALYPTLQPANFVSAASAGSAASVTTTGVTTTSGSLFVAPVFAFGNNIGSTPLSDSNGNTWTAAITTQGSTKGWGAMYYVANGIGGASHTFTFTPSSNDFLVICVFEIPGAKTSGVLGNTNFSTASTTTHASGTVTVGADDPEILIGGCALSAAAEGAGIITSQFHALAVRLAATGTTEGACVGYRVAPASTTDQFAVTTSSVQNETILIAGFKAAEASGGSGLTWAPISILAGTGLSLIRTIASGSGMGRS